VKLKCVCHDFVFPKVQGRTGLIFHYEQIINERHPEINFWKLKYKKLVEVFNFGITCLRDRP